MQAAIEGKVRRMPFTNLVLGDNWPEGEWPDYVEVMHEGAGDSRKYIQEKTTRLIWNKHKDCWECETCGEDWGERYFREDCVPYGWNNCSNCGARITKVVKQDV